MRLLAIAVLALAADICVAQSNAIIEQSLTADAKHEKRLLDGRKVVSRLARQGVFKRKPTERFDYSDFYVPLKPVQVLGARLVLFEHEHQSRYIGCCINPGNAVVLLPSGGTAEIEAFARRNKCKYSVGDRIIYMPERALDGLTMSERSALVQVSCKDDYLVDDEVWR